MRKGSKPVINNTEIDLPPNSLKGFEVLGLEQCGLARFSKEII